GNSFQPSTGIALAAKNGETFDVLAAMSGVVTMVEQDSVLGNIVVIEHADGIETRYQALDEVLVKEGDKVKQGEVIGNAGKSLINQDAGVHLHFEIRKNDVPVNPLNYFEKSLTTLQNADSDSENATDEQTDSENEEADETDERKDEDESADDENNEDANDNSNES